MNDDDINFLISMLQILIDFPMTILQKERVLRFEEIRDEWVLGRV